MSPMSPALQAGSYLLSHTGKPDGSCHITIIITYYSVTVDGGNFGKKVSEVYAPWSAPVSLP